MSTVDKAKDAVEDVRAKAAGMLGNSAGPDHGDSGGESVDHASAQDAADKLKEAANGQE
jgi:hypothetical protein